MDLIRFFISQYKTDYLAGLLCRMCLALPLSFMDRGTIIITYIM